RTDTHLGTSVAAEAERPLGKALVVRSGGGASVSQRSKGIEWVSEAALLASLGWRTAAQLGAAANGATAAVPPFDRFRTYARLRRDVYRRWIFAELEPGVAWPWTAERGREPVWSVALRIELQFQAIEKPRPPPPLPPEEPRDPPPEPDDQGDPLPPAGPPG
ncbi:MAG TPA: hypothetical protein VLT61_06905, partial [Anaeromyxobacteraceae bacterium]|nr:hypothetical protein [Anaeromyxobacteraceae bacterium]